MLRPDLEFEPRRPGEWQDALTGERFSTAAGQLAIPLAPAASRVVDMAEQRYARRPVAVADADARVRDWALAGVWGRWVHLLDGTGSGAPVICVVAARAAPGRVPALTFMPICRRSGGANCANVRRSSGPGCGCATSSSQRRSSSRVVSIALS